jgi:cell division protein FtsL
MNEIKEYIAQSKETSEDIQRAFIAVTILTVLLMVISIVIGFKHIELGIKYTALEQEKEELEELVEMQNSMITDLETNCKDLFVELDSLRGK